MYSRRIINQLLAWKDKPGRKPLVLRGARQVGKTTLVKEFSKQFHHFIYLNLEMPADAAVFQTHSDVHSVIDFLFLRQHIQKSETHSTLLFIDEIQEEEAAIAMLRYFYELPPWLYVIAAGSRLQSLVRKHISFPVGRVEYLTLRPFSFEEYVNAIEGEDWGKMLKNISVSNAMHSTMTALFNRYALIGGMPEVVATYAHTHDIEALSPIYRSLQSGYADDVERYAKNETQATVMRHILQHGWTAAGQTITFARFAGSNYTSQQVHEAILLLQKAFILSLDYPVTSVHAPAVPALSRSPKMIWVDTGLVNFFTGIQVEYLQNKELLDTWRGYAAKQIVAQELRVVLDRTYQDEQYFWVRDKKGTTAEVDFVWQNGLNIVPIEVKSGTNSHFRSIHSFVNLSEREVVAVRVWSGELSVQQVQTPAPFCKPYTLLNIPFYYVGQIDRILNMQRNSELQSLLNRK
ncbi:MAG: ATP-binding protein [Sodaliphilus sp.]